MSSSEISRADRLAGAFARADSRRAATAARFAALDAARAIEALTGATVSADEASACLAWCREWALDCEWREDADTIEDMAPAALLAACNRAIEGGLRFVLDDVRRLAAPAILRTALIAGAASNYALAPREDAASAAYVAIYREGANPSVYEQTIAASSFGEALSIATREASSRGLAVVGIALGSPAIGAAILDYQIGG